MIKNSILLLFVSLLSSCANLDSLIFDSIKEGYAEGQFKANKYSNLNAETLDLIKRTVVQN